MVSAPRKGAARVADVAPDILARLNIGQIEAATLSENLATDFATLLAATIPEPPKVTKKETLAVSVLFRTVPCATPALTFGCRVASIVVGRSGANAPWMKELT